jgi:hypothetical protein
MNNIYSFGHCSGGSGYIQAEKNKKNKTRTKRTKKRGDPKAAPDFIRTLREAGPEYCLIVPSPFVISY